MAEKSGFFNARETEDGTYDREYDAEQFAEYFSNFISNGVYANPANQLKVVFDDSSSKPFVVTVRKGKAYIDGYWYELTEDMEITIPVNTASYAIKDVICCTLDKTERKVSIVLKEDVISDIPVNNNAQHDLVLSTVLVQPNASKLNAEDITDKRPDKTYCGFVTGVIDQIDTTELFKQYDDTFKTWFNEIKGQLSTDAAGNIQTQIGLLSNLKTKVKDSIVNAINSLYDSTIGKTLKTLDEVSSNTEQGSYVDALVISELNRKLFHHQGDSYDFDINTGGFITGDGVNPKFTIPCKQVSESVTGVSITDLRIWIRQNGYYIAGDSRNAYSVSSEKIKTKIQEGFIAVSIKIPYNSMVKNNDSIGIQAAGTINFV